MNLCVRAVKSKEFVVTGATLMLVAYTLALSLVGQVFPAFQTSRTVSNVGEVKAIGVNLYRDIECTLSLSSIPWGFIEPGGTKNYNIYARNEGDYNIYLTLDIDANSWIPTEASNYLVLSWNYDNSTIIPDDVKEITLDLYCDPSVTGVDTFSFDIIITGISVG